MHAKLLLVDPLSDEPIVVCGSANFSMASTTANDENMLVVRGPHARRMARLLLVEFMRVHAHFACRSEAQQQTDGATEGELSGADDGSAAAPAWWRPYFLEGSRQRRERELFGRESRE